MSRPKTDIISAVTEYFNEMRDEIHGKTVCVCLSGGADSVALLCALKEINESFGFALCACHFNHLIRGEEAERDELFCESLCSETGVVLYKGREDVPAYASESKLSLEEAARKLRYSFFESLLKSGRFDYYATAHNMNDDAETLLMNLIRGSGCNGASSLAKRSGALLRPLLSVERSEIERYLAASGRSYVHDGTNDDVRYLRNKIRREIIPALEKINPRVVSALADYASSVREDRGFFESLIEKCDYNDLRVLEKPLRLRIIAARYKSVTGEIPSRERLLAVDKALFDTKRRVVGVGFGYDAVVCEGEVAFSPSVSTVEDYPETVVQEGRSELFGGAISVFYGDNPVNTQNFNNLAITCTLSFDNICGELKVSRRIKGDRIRVFGVNRSVKKMMIENKIPAEYRDIIPVFRDNEGVVYIPFVGIADRAYPKGASSTKTLITVFNSIEQERWRQAYENKRFR